MSLSSCKTEKKTPETKDSSLKHISELTYMDIYRLLYNNNNGGFDAHGDLYGQEAASFLNLVEEPSQCGKSLYLVNTSDKTIELALEATFNFPSNPNNEIVRAYKIQPSEKISIGNSMLCYDNEEYLIGKKIISAGFQKPNQ